MPHSSRPRGSNRNRPLRPPAWSKPAPSSRSVVSSSEPVGAAVAASSSFPAGGPPTRHERSSSIARTPQTPMAASIACSGSANGAAHRNTPSCPENVADTPSKPCSASSEGTRCSRSRSTLPRNNGAPTPHSTATPNTPNPRIRRRYLRSGDETGTDICHHDHTRNREGQPAPAADTARDQVSRTAVSSRWRARTGQEKLDPQPHVRVALGFVIANPDWSSPSL